MKPGKGAAFVRTKIKNVMTGAVVERSFNPTDKMPKAILETKEMQYLYNDGDLYYFMDLETYEQLPLNRSQVEDAIPYVKENTNVTVRFFKGNAFSVEAPNFVDPGGYRYRTRLQGRHRFQHLQARHRGDRLHPAGAAVHQHGRHDPHRHPYRRIHGACVNFFPTAWNQYAHRRKEDI